MVDSLSTCKLLLSACTTAGLNLLETQDKNGMTPLMARRQVLSVFPALLDAKASISALNSKSGETVLSLLARGQNAAADVALRYASIADLLHANSCGNTALHEAATVANIHFVESVLKQHSDSVPAFLAAKNNLGQTPLHAACCGTAAAHNRLALVKLLLESKADLNSADGNGGTPAHHAAEMGLADVMQLLLDHGANVELRTCDAARGETPLHCAVRFLMNGMPDDDSRRHTIMRRADCFRMLLRHKARCLALNARGQTVMEVITELESKARLAAEAARAKAIRESYCFGPGERTIQEIHFAEKKDIAVYASELLVKYGLGELLANATTDNQLTFTAASLAAGGGGDHGVNYLLPFPLELVPLITSYLPDREETKNMEKMGQKPVHVHVLSQFYKK